MKAFLTQFLASMLGSVLGFFLLAGLGFFLLIALAIAVGDGQAHENTMEESILVIDMSFSLEDAPPELNPEDAFFEVLAGVEPSSVYLLETTRAIRRAATDPRIHGILLHGNLRHENYGSGLPALREFRQSLEAFQSSEKPIYAFLETPSTRDYYVASVADTIILHPAGSLPIHGIGMNVLFLGDMFKQYGIGMQVLRTGKYKSAVETFTRNRLSEPAKEQLTEEIHALWENLVDQIQASRKISKDTLEALSTNQVALLPQEALEAGLIDAVEYRDELFDKLALIAGTDPAINSFAQTDLLDYMDQRLLDKFAAFAPKKDYIAVVYAEGEIMHGSAYPEQVSDERLCFNLRKFRHDERCKAVVLRVNSPGGSALASDIIQREVRLLKAKKPLVVSMGSYAASGGYWISAYADHIFADPMTLTGSIGVFGLVPNFQKIANNHGITFDRIVSAKHADIQSLARPKTDEEMQILQRFVDHTYDAFIQKVAEGRNMPADSVHKVAQGRVWTGQAALEQGLVDQIGGLRDAIQYTAERAGLPENCPLVEAPRRKLLEQTLAEAFSKEQKPEPLIQSKSPWMQLPIFQQLSPLTHIVTGQSDPQHIYTRMPWLLIVD